MAKPPRYKYAFSSETPLPAGSSIFYSRCEIHPRRTRPVKLHDIIEMLLMGFYLCVAAAVPVRHWNSICGFVSHLRLQKHRRKLFVTLERDLAAIAPTADPESFFSEYRTMLHRRRLYYMAQVAGWRWKPEITVEGAEKISSALSEGRGVLVWCENTSAQTLIGKRALHEAGIEAYQVNAREHGLSTSTFGKSVINPILIGIENRFLKGRFAFGSSDTVPVTRRILEALWANAVVLISANTYHGRRFAQAPMGNGYCHVATTPANFAAAGRTALLAMSTVETVPFREFRAVIRPIASPGHESPEPGAKDAALANVISAFRDASESTATNFPAQCLGIGRDLVSYSVEERAGFRQRTPLDPGC